MVAQTCKGFNNNYNSILYTSYYFFNLLLVSESSTRQYIYNFEEGYIFNKHEARLANIYNVENDFLDRFIESAKPPEWTNREYFTAETVIDFINEARSNGVSNYEIREYILEAVNGNNKVENNIYLKRWNTYSYLPELLFLLVIPLPYFFLIGFYCLILYIAKGKTYIQWK